MSLRDEFHDSEKIYNKAAKAELERDYDRAFRLYVKAAEGFLYLDRSATDQAFRAACKSEAAKALERAEKLKSVRQNLTPVVTDSLSEGEQSLVLQKSSLVNGVHYPLWSGPAFATSSVTLSQPALSPEQISKLAFWRKVTGARIYSSESPLSPADIIQHVVSDCSVCASIAVCINHDLRFRSRLYQSKLYPQDSNGDPAASQNGCYYVRLHFNGACRRVNIDDQLPAYPDGTLMCMSTGTKNILWPSLIEKAYMRVMGGYDFPGSLSTTDLYTLIGWIPEYVDMTRTSFEREKTWRRIVTGFQEGFCVLTVGTGERPHVEKIGHMSLIPAHCYAITDIFDNSVERSMTVLDTWTGATEEATDEHELKLSGLTLENDERARSFEMSWDVVCSTFQGIYLNWSPTIFTHKIDFHGKWKNGAATKSYPRHHRIDLQIDHDATATRQSTVWLLLNRHITDTRRKREYISLSVGNDDSATSDLDPIKGEYTDTTHVLVKAEYSSRDPTLNIIASYDGEYNDVGFTISAFSCSPLIWKAQPAKMLFYESVAGTFTTKSAGGNPTLPTFMLNPQYHLRIYPELSKKMSGRGPKATACVTVKGDRHIAFSASIVWSNGQRITEMVESDTVASSGPYKYGYASHTGQLTPGDYTLIVSTFDMRHTGSYLLEVESSLRFDITPIPQEGAGMFSKIVNDSWTGNTAAGGPSSKRYTSNPVFKLDVPKTSQAIIRLQWSQPGPLPSLNVTIFNRNQKLGLGSHVATSGPYSDAVCGVVTPHTALQPGSYFVIPSTFQPGTEGKFKLFIYTSASGVSITRTALHSADTVSSAS